MEIYVGNLPYEVTDEDLRGAFESFGEIESAAVIMDRSTGRSKGFGFVKMREIEDANSAIAALDGKDFKGRILKVNEARQRPQTDLGAAQGNTRRF